MRISRALPLAATFLLVCVARPVSAQKLECVLPSEPSNANERCTYQAPASKTSHPLVIRLVDMPAGLPMVQNLNLSLDPATNGSVTKTVATDAQGLATFVWTGQAGSKEVVIRVSGDVAGKTVQREIQIVAAPTTTSRSLRLSEGTGVPHWFIERQLRDSIRVVVDNPGTDCTANTVLFKPSSGDGTASADTVRAVVENGACVATTWWTLGKPIGRQHLRASLSNEPAKSVTVTAIGRNVPRVGLGVAFVRDSRNYEYVDTTGLVVDAGNDWKADPALLVDFPVVPSARWLRGVAGVSLKDASRDWYFGISALQPMFGVTRESVGVDLQFLVHAGRRDVLKNRRCDDDGDAADCVNKEDKVLFPLGFGFAGYVDTTALVSNLAGLFKL